MTFDELWAQVDALPEMAKRQIPGVLSESTKKRLSKHSPEDVSNIVAQAIYEVDHGSVETLDTLIKKRL